MKIVLKDERSGWFYIGFGSWSPNRRFAYEFASEEEIRDELISEAIVDVPMTWEKEIAAQ